jgi:peptide/nickel transport system substrate-binding protein
MLNRTDPNQETESGERSNIQFPHPLFSDKGVRQAFAHAIDRETIAALYGHNASPTTNYLVGPSIYNSPNTSGLYDFDLARAADLLDEAGWVDTDQDGIRDKEGVKMSVVFQTTLNPVRQQTQEIVKQTLESLGVEVELKVIDASVFFDPDPSNTNNAWHFHADMQEYFAGSAFDPGVYMRIRTCSEIPQQANDWTGLNIARWCNPEYDALYEQSTVELDPERRRQLFILMNDLLIEDVALIPLVNLFVSSGVGHTLEGVELTPWDSHMWNVKDWRREQE